VIESEVGGIGEVMMRVLLFVALRESGTDRDEESANV
jgi:hypothetical protein